MLLAALLWSLIGLMLIARGVLATIGTGYEWLIAIAAIIGVAKSLAVLDRVAVKNMVRIFEKGEYSCLGGVYSWKTWLLVATMVIIGKLLRSSSLPTWLVGTIYVAVGWSLLWSSRKAWAGLRALPAKDPGGENDEKLS